MAGGLAIALSGGGAKGAFQVGVIDELVTRRGVDFETVVGTSTGAIQAAGVAQDTVPELLDFWLGLKGPDDIYRSRGGPIWAIITGKNSIYSTGPLKGLLKSAFRDEDIRKTGKNLRIAVVNINTGKLNIVGENADQIHDWVYASSAQPPFFPPFETRDSAGVDEQWVDGGVRDVTPFAAALRERPKSLLVVRAEAPLKPRSKSFDNLAEIGLRSVEILTREVADCDLKNVGLFNDFLEAETDQRLRLASMGLSQSQIDEVMKPFADQINRYKLVPTLVLEPDTDLYDTLEFVPSLIRQNIDRGRRLVERRWQEIAAFLDVPE